MTASITPIAAPQSVERIFTVLERLASCAANGASLADLARATQAPKSSLVSLLAGMVSSGHVSKDATGVYRLGVRMFSLSMRVVGSLDLQTFARPVLETLMDATGETVLLGTLGPAGDLAMYIDKVESRSALRYTVSLGEQRELHCTSIGKLLLAFMPERRQDAYLRSHALKRYTDATITSPQALRDHLATIRAAGYAATAGEQIVGADAIAAPVFGFGGELIAALVVAGPSERMRAHRESHVASLKTAATHLTRVMGAPAVASADAIQSSSSP
jgi:DNA-binding IclR family transcriptional regulator